MHINPWTLYLVLQLDSIRAGLSALCVLLVIVMATFFVLWGVAESEIEYNWSETRTACAKLKIPTYKKALRQTFAALLAGGALLVITPSTKTAAAIIVIPAIANNPNVQREAGELYDLAKQALKESITKDEATTTPTEKEEGDK